MLAVVIGFLAGAASWVGRSIILHPAMRPVNPLPLTCWLGAAVITSQIWIVYTFFTSGIGDGLIAIAGYIFGVIMTAFVAQTRVLFPLALLAFPLMIVALLLF